MNRNRLPGIVNWLIDRLADSPASPLGRLAALRFGRPLPGVATSELGDAPVRVLIAPVNYAGQAKAWAESLEKFDPSISARNFAVEVPGGFSFDSDLLVPVPTYHNDSDWQHRQLRAAARASHFLIEAEEPPFGRLFGRSLKRQAAAIESQGTSVAYIAHGTDARLPSRHIRENPLSYYSDSTVYIPRAEAIAARNIAYLEHAGKPVFVSTPDLLTDLPNAHWCPVAVDLPRWDTERTVRRPGSPLRVAHAPSVAAFKGTHLIMPTLEKLQREGVIEFTLIQGVPSADMPATFAQADVLIDQFRSASYGVAACEAMAAGCVVVGQAGDRVRSVVEDTSGLALPIVEATPDTLETVLRRLALDPEFTEIAEASKEFVRHVHDGRLAAKTLVTHWISQNQAALPVAQSSSDPTKPDFSPMHIALVSRIYRPEPSAASLFLGSVADELSASGHEVTVLTAKPLSVHRGTARQPHRERVRTFPVLRDRSGYVRGYLQYLSFDIPLFFRLLFSKRPDLVFVEPPPTTGAVVRIVCALRRIPYVYDAADIWSDAAGQVTSSRFVLKTLKLLERFAMQGARELVTISQDVVDRARALGVRTDATVTGFGADVEAFSYAPEVPNERLFLYAGTYSDVHGAEVLVSAFAEFSRTHPGYRLRFVGNGTSRESLRAIASEVGVSEYVSFEDAITPERLSPLFSTAIASLATVRPGSGYEYAFATKAYSSLAAGCPVIFAGPGPTYDFIRDSAEGVSLGAAVDYDADRIAAAMRSLADRPLTPEERSDLARWTASEHSIRTVAEKVADVLTALPDGTARSRRNSAHG